MPGQEPGQGVTGRPCAATGWATPPLAPYALFGAVAVSALRRSRAHLASARTLLATSRWAAQTPRHSRNTMAVVTMRTIVPINSTTSVVGTS